MMTDAPIDVTVTSEEAPAGVAMETDWKAEAEKLKAESRKWENRSKENQKAAQRLAEIEESSKTELQKALERAEAAEQRANAFESERQITAWRQEVAAASGVPVDALRGSSKEELEAHAETLKPYLVATNRLAAVIPGPGNIPDKPVSDDAAWFGRALRGE